MSTEQKSAKPQLHQSHLQTLYRCGIKFERTVLNGEREPASTPLIIGTATHGSINLNLTNKITRGTLLTREAVQDLTRDQFTKSWQETAVVLNEGERSMGLKKARSMAQDTTIELALVHHYSIAPKIHPKSVERKWVLEAPQFKFDMAGTIDIDEEIEFDKAAGLWLPRPIVKIRDTKTRGRNLGQKEVDSSEQYTFYAMAKFLIDGKMPDKVVQDNLVKATNSRPAYAISYESTRTQDDFEVARKRFQQAINVINTGAFTPANPSDWWCSKDFCGFAADGSCPYFNSKRSPTPKPNPGANQQGGKNGEQDSSTGGLIAGLENAIITDGDRG